MERDASEIGENLGQQLRDTFHLADVFIDGIAHDQMKTGIMRFIEAFFGKTDTTPRKDEYGMYAAKSASLRSAGLSRQVGLRFSQRMETCSYRAATRSRRLAEVCIGTVNLPITET